jgi:hypothetical protein
MKINEGGGLAAIVIAKRLLTDGWNTIKYNEIRQFLAAVSIRFRLFNHCSKERRYFYEEELGDFCLWPY